MENPAKEYDHGGDKPRGLIAAIGGLVHRVVGHHDDCPGHKADNDSPEWTATIFTTAAVKKDELLVDPKGHFTDTKQELDFLDLGLVGEHGYVDAEETCDLAKWSHADHWKSLDGRDLGFSYTGKIRIPTSIGTPQVAVFWNRGGHDNPSSFPISRLVLTPPSDAGQQPITFAVNSNIHKSQGARIFFDDKPRLLSQTSEFLKKFRDFELAELRGEEELSTPADWERVYQYDVYNDLGNPTEEKDQRPVLGGFAYEGDVFDENGEPNMPESGSGKGRKIGYPRRLRTGRGLYEDTPYENPVRTAKGSKNPEPYWIPLDERFDEAKEKNFDVTSQLYKVSLLKQVLAGLAKRRTTLLGGYLDIKSDNPTPFPSIEIVNSLYTTPLSDKIEEIDAAIVHGLGTLSDVHQIAVGLIFGWNVNDLTKLLKRSKLGEKVDLSHMSEGFKDMVAKLRALVDTEYEKPLVYEGREELWETDEEWGRQTIAGQNPCIIKAIKEIPKESTVKEHDLRPHLGGHVVKDILGLEVPRLFLIDYSLVYPEYTKLINAKKEKKEEDDKKEKTKDDEKPEISRCQYAGRAYLFLRDDNKLVPVAIELFTGETDPVVYTPSDPANMWLTVKAVFSSIDAGFHQLYSHFTRTHACLEPGLIALRRTMSPMHPVYKLMMPHFRFTLNINRNARQTLINNGGVIESNFTPGKFSLTLAAEVYTRLWRFDKQALPADLIDRKMAKMGEDGKIQLVLPDYPYGSDGLLVWNSVEKWVFEYLSLYYTGDKEVTDDEELTAWWDEFKHKGHADKKDGWPELKGVKDLTLILTTIIWLASAHHAAVNFGQYGYSGYMPNRSSIVHYPIPTKGTKEYKDLAANLDRHFFKILARPFESLQVMTTVALLSTHSENEQYISDREHFYIFDDKAREVYNKHVDAILEVEEEIEHRNEDRTSTVRSKSEGGLPYTLLAPKSGPGRTGRGIPNSVSI